MALIEQELARRIVEARYLESTGTTAVTVTMAEHIADMEAQLDREQWWRAQMGRMADLVEAAGGADRAVRTVEGAEMTNQGSDA